MVVADSSNNKGVETTPLAPLWIVAFFFFVGIIIWYLYHDFIVSTIFHVKMFEAQLVSLFTNRLTPIMAEMVSMPISDVTFDHLTRLSVEIGTVVRYPIIVILLLLAWLMYVSGITSRFKQTYDMRKLLEAEVGNWPHATPVVGLDLLKESLDSGPWAMAKPPLEFSIENKLLKQDEKKGPISWSKRKEPPPLTIRRNEAKGLFKLQMGERWKSPNALNGHTKALFAIFAAKFARDNDYLALVHQLSRTAAVGKINYSGTSALLRKHANDKKVVEVTQKACLCLYGDGIDVGIVSSGRCVSDSRIFMVKTARSTPLVDVEYDWSSDAFHRSRRSFCALDCGKRIWPALYLPFH